MVYLGIKDGLFMTVSQQWHGFTGNILRRNVVK